MTPKERKKAIRQGKDVDRQPITLFHPDFAAKVLGMTVHESTFQAENLAKREINMYSTFGVDEVQVMYTGMPKYTSSLIHDFSDVSKLDPFNYSFEKDRRQKINYEAIERIQTAIGQEITITYGVSGPITLAGGLMGHELLLRGLRKEKEIIHQLLRFTTDFLKSMAENFKELELNFCIFDPVASGSLISPKQYSEFAHPYLKEVIADFHHYSEEVSLHICGNTTKILPKIAETGADYFSLDQVVDIAVAKELIGDKIGLMGNINPTQVLMQGSPDMIYNEVDLAYKKGHDCPKGFIIRSGCGVPYDTPVENVQAYIEAASELGNR